LRSGNHHIIEQIDRISYKVFFGSTGKSIELYEDNLKGIDTPLDILKAGHLPSALEFKLNFLAYTIGASMDLIDEKARRFLVFKRKELAKEYEIENTPLLRLRNAIEEQWISLSSGNEMFGNSNDVCITHGRKSDTNDNAFVSELLTPTPGVWSVRGIRVYLKRRTTGCLV